MSGKSVTSPQDTKNKSINKPKATDRKFTWDIVNKETATQGTEPVSAESIENKPKQPSKIPPPRFSVPDDICTRRNSLGSTPPQHRPRARSSSKIPTPKFGSPERDSCSTSFDGTTTPTRTQRSRSINLMFEDSVLAASIEAASNKQLLMQPARTRIFFLFENELEKLGLDTKLIKNDNMLLLTAVVSLPQGELTTTANIAKNLYKNISGSLPKLKLADVENALSEAFRTFNQKKSRSSSVATPPQPRTRSASPSVVDTVSATKLGLGTCERTSSKSAPSSPVAGTEPAKSLYALLEPIPVTKVTMHISPTEPPLGENKVPGVSPGNDPIQWSPADFLAFKYAKNPKSHGLLVDLNMDREHKPWRKMHGLYPIQHALSHLTETSLSTSSLYDYMNYSIKQINDAANSGQAQIISQQDLNSIVAQGNYAPELKQRWKTYVENFGLPSEVSR